MSTDNREDYLINILRLAEDRGVVKTTDLSNFMNVSPASVTEMLKVLQKEGLVNYERYRGVSLTEDGDRKARDLRRKHHIMERFLTDVLGVDRREAHEQACAVEHSISEDAANKMCRLVGAKVDNDCATCQSPCHDRPEDKGECVPLTELGQGTQGIICHLSAEDGQIIRKLISMGFVPGREIELTATVSDKGARVMRLGGTVIALDAEMASCISVRPT